jgi:flagellar biosynthesis component FlhA
LVTKGKNAPLLQKIAEARNSVSIPRMHSVDNLQLRNNEFRLIFFSEEIERGVVTEENAVDVIIQAIIKTVKKSFKQLNH